jgi:hypothetical protein
MNLRIIVRGGYDLQKLRIQVGNRLVGNFKVKLGQKPGDSEGALDENSKKILADLRATLPKISDVITMSEHPEVDGAEDVDDSKTDSERKAAKAGKLILDLVNTRYKVVTDGRKTFPSRATFKGDAVISDYTELSLIAQYVDLERQEKQHFARLENILQDYPIYTEFLSKVRGCGPMMSGVILSEIDIHKAQYPSSLWKFAGLDVASDGRGRSRRTEHLVERAYTNKEGKAATRMGITFQPLLKTKLIGVLGPSFIKMKGSEYDTIYRNYKHRMENHEKYGVHNDGKEDPETGYKITSKGRRHAMAVRYAVKIFLMNLHIAWRKLEGLPVSLPYHEAKLGMKHRGESAA